MRAMVYDDRLNKLDVAYLILRTSILVSLRPLRGVVVSFLQDIAILTVKRQ